MNGSAVKADAAAESQRSFKPTPAPIPRKGVGRGSGLSPDEQKPQQTLFFFLNFILMECIFSRYENISYTEIRNQTVAIKEGAITVGK